MTAALLGSADFSGQRIVHTLHVGESHLDEGSVVTERPAHGHHGFRRVFTHPNRLTKADFVGWARESGLCCLSGWDERYTPPLQIANLVSLRSEGRRGH